MVGLAARQVLRDRCDGRLKSITAGQILVLVVAGAIVLAIAGTIAQGPHPAPGKFSIVDATITPYYPPPGR